MPILLSPEIASRKEFGWLLVHRGLLGVAVEIGVHKGGFAKTLLDAWPGQVFYAVDPYRDASGCADCNLSQLADIPKSRAIDLRLAIASLAVHGTRVVFVPLPDSREIGDGIMRGAMPPDFVYIDGDHSYAAAKLDIDIWWPRLSPVGILAGHDYTPEHAGVMRAVREFAAAENLTVYLTHDNAFKSWYVYRTPVTAFREYESVPEPDRLVAMDTSTAD